MKKKLLLPLCMCLLSACGSGGTDYSGYTTVSVESDRAVYAGLDELLNDSDIVVIGEFCSDAEQELTYSYSDEYGKEVLTDAVSTSRVSVSQVLYGSFDGKEVRVSQRYGVSDKEKELVTFSSLLPMEKNDKWIFFLYHDGVNDTYWCTGDCCGRLPLFEGTVRNTVSEYMELQSELDEILRQNESVPADEIEKYYSEGRTIFYDSAYNAYALEESQAEKPLEKMKKMEELRTNTVPREFGVYSADEVDLALYSEVVRYFDF